MQFAHAIKQVTILCPLFEPFLACSSCSSCNNSRKFHGGGEHSLVGISFSLSMQLFVAPRRRTSFHEGIGHLFHVAI